MASALLASRNEACWGEGNVYMRKNPNSNPNWRPNPSPNPNPNPKHKTKRIPDKPPTYDSSSYRKSSEPVAPIAPAFSDDSSSLNRKFVNPREPSHGAYVTFNISSFSRRELKDLKKRFVTELNQVRKLSDRIESRDFQSRSGYSTTGGGYGGREVTSLTPRPSQLPHTSEPPLPDNEMPSKVSGSKRSSSSASGRDPKRMAMEPAGASAAAASVQPAMERLLAEILKKCLQLLTKLMKQKNCWVFNTPVDVVGMGLHDYNHIIKHPMDLGTVKSKLRSNQYSSPVDFAADVRLTFNNALTYNPSSHEVYVYAQNLLSNFEEMFKPAYRSYEDERQRIVNWAEKMNDKTHVPVNKSSMGPSPLEQQHKERKKSIEAKEHRRRDDHKEVGGGGGGMQRGNHNHNHRHPSERRRPPEPIPLPPPVVPAPAPAPAPTPAPSASATMRMVGRQPKPRAKDKDKRDMSFEEKQKLSLGLQSLPQEKMDQVVHIIKKRNPVLPQQGEEIEVDIEAVDTETLWELDRFVGYYKKTMSKIKRQSLAAANQNSSFEAAPAPQLPQGHGKASVEEEETHPGVAAAFTGNKKNRKGETGGGGGMEEEIDIGEDMPANNFPPVEIEKDIGGGYASRSSSSSSSSSSDDDSSSNSDSDSGSSSGSDSDDGDNQQSPGGRGVVESKPASQC